MWYRAVHRARRNYQMMSTTEETNNTRPTAAAGSPAPLQRSRKAAPTRAAARTKTLKATSARKGSKTAKILALSKTARWRGFEGADEGHWLAASFSSRLPQRRPD
jgi:hypothetical protein